MNLKNFLLKFIPTIIFVVLLFIVDSVAALFLFYLTGLVFGTSIYLLFEKLIDIKTNVYLLIGITLIFFVILLFVSNSINLFLEYRKLFYGSLGALMVLQIIHYLAKIKFTKIDYFIAILLGFITTRNTLNEELSIQHLILGVFFWQIGMIIIINNRINSEIKKTIYIENDNHFGKIFI